MAFHLDFKAQFGSEMARKWRGLAPFFTFAPLRLAPTYLVRGSGAVALKVVQLPSTGERYRSALSGY